MRVLYTVFFHVQRATPHMAHMAALGDNVPVSSHTAEKVTRAKMTLENYYLNLVAQHEERENRYKKLEKTMEDEGLSEEQVCYK